MNEFVVGTWWFVKEPGAIYAYKGPNPPNGSRCGDDYECTWIDLINLNDYSWMCGNSKIHISSTDLGFINLDYLESRVSKVTIYKSGNYVVEDYE